jgi:Tol biopolymer transport system component
VIVIALAVLLVANAAVAVSWLGRDTKPARHVQATGPHASPVDPLSGLVVGETTSTSAAGLATTSTTAKPTASTAAAHQPTATTRAGSSGPPVASASLDLSALYYLNTASGQTKRMAGSTTQFDHVAWAASGGSSVGFSDASEVRQVDVTTGAVSSHPGLPSPALAVEWSGDLQMVAAVVINDTANYDAAFGPTSDPASRHSISSADVGDVSAVTFFDHDHAGVAIVAAGDVWRANLDASALTRLTTGLSGHHLLCASPNGRMAFGVSDGTVYVMDDGGANRHVLAHNANRDARCSWNASGDSVTYGSTSGAVMVAKADGTESHQVALGRLPIWSGDGLSLAYVQGHDIHEAKADGSADHVVFRGSGADIASIAWSSGNVDDLAISTGGGGEGGP